MTNLDPTMGPHPFNQAAIDGERAGQCIDCGYAEINIRHDAYRQKTSGTNAAQAIDVPRVWGCTVCPTVIVLIDTAATEQVESDKLNHLLEAHAPGTLARFVEWHPEWPATEPASAIEGAIEFGGIDTKARGLELAIEWTKDDPGVTLPRVLKIASAFEAHLETVNAEIVEADETEIAAAVRVLDHVAEDLIVISEYDRNALIAAGRFLKNLEADQ